MNKNNFTEILKDKQEETCSKLPAVFLVRVSARSHARRGLNGNALKRNNARHRLRGTTVYILPNA